MKKSLILIILLLSLGALLNATQVLVRYVEPTPTTNYGYVYNQLGNTGAGWICQWIKTTDNVQDQPNLDGTPGGDDVLVTNTNATYTIAWGPYNRFAMSTYLICTDTSTDANFIAIGNMCYLRIYNASTVAAATQYIDFSPITIAASPATQHFNVGATQTYQLGSWHLINPVTNHSISGNVTGDGVALAGATVACSDGTVNLTATTDASGNYTITDVPDGTYTLTCSKTNWNSSSLTGVAVAGADLTGKNFAITSPAPGQPTNPVPADGSINVSPNALISWTAPAAVAGILPTSYKISLNGTEYNTGLNTYYQLSNQAAGNLAIIVTPIFTPTRGEANASKKAIANNRSNGAPLSWHVVISNGATGSENGTGSANPNGNSPVHVDLPPTGAVNPDMTVTPAPGVTPTGVIVITATTNYSNMFGHVGNGSNFRIGFTFDCNVNWLGGDITIDLGYVPASAPNVFYFDAAGPHAASYDWTPGTSIITVHGLSITTRSDVVSIGVGDGDFTLPVTLTAFSAVLTSDGNTANLSWTTASESHMMGYSILRGTTQDNAVSIHSEAALNQSINHTYNYADNVSELDNGVYSYWLQMVDLDGTITLSQPCTVEINHNGGGGDVPVVTTFGKGYPNPFNPAKEAFRADVSAKERITMKVYDIKGRLVDTVVKDVNGNNQQIVWAPKANLANGVYFYRLEGKNTVETHKILILKNK